MENWSNSLELTVRDFLLENLSQLSWNFTWVSSYRPKMPKLGFSSGKLTVRTTENILCLNFKINHVFLACSSQLLIELQWRRSLGRWAISDYRENRASLPEWREIHKNRKLWKSKTNQQSKQWNWREHKLAVSHLQQQRIHQYQLIAHQQANGAHANAFRQISMAATNFTNHRGSLGWRSKFLLYFETDTKFSRSLSLSIVSSSFLGVWGRRTSAVHLQSLSGLSAARIFNET